MSGQPVSIPSAPQETRYLCPWCGRWAQHVWCSMYRKRTSGFSPATEEGEEVVGVGTTLVHWKQSQCMACERWATWREEEMVFPDSGTLPPAHPEMPDKVKPLYEEARRVAAVSPRAGAALARSTLEALLKEIVGQEGDEDTGKRQVDLYALIDRTVGSVSTGLRKMLTVIRHVGNEGLHPKENPDAITVLVLDSETTAVMGLLFVAVNDCVDELIVKPRENDALFDSLPDRVKKSVQES